MSEFNQIVHHLLRRWSAFGLCSLFLIVSLVPGFLPVADGSQETVPDFRLPTIDGTTFEIQNVLGKKIVVLNFWATWCIPCRREMLHLQKLYDQYRETGLQVIAISVDDASKQSQVKPFVKKYQYTFPVLLDTDSLIIKKFQTQSEIPLTLVIDRGGRVVRRFQGYKPGDEEILKTDIRKLLDAR